MQKDVGNLNIYFQIQLILNVIIMNNNINEFKSPLTRHRIFKMCHLFGPKKKCMNNKRNVKRYDTI